MGVGFIVARFRPGASAKGVLSASLPNPQRFGAAAKRLVNLVNADGTGPRPPSVWSDSTAPPPAECLTPEAKHPP
jgi:hypothetical protein